MDAASCGPASRERAGTRPANAAAAGVKGSDGWLAVRRAQCQGRMAAEALRANVHGPVSAVVGQNRQELMWCL